MWRYGGRGVNIGVVGETCENMVFSEPTSWNKFKKLSFEN